MAVLAYGSNVRLEWQNGAADKTAVYQVSDVNTGDTINLSPDFLAINSVAFLGITTNQVLEAGSISGTTVTIPAGLTAEAGYMLVYGESA
jgi:hypothetical protein